MSPLKLPETIAGQDPLQIRDMFATFIEAPSKLRFKDGVPQIASRKLTAGKVSKSLGLTAAEGRRVHAALIAEGWLDKAKLHPTHQGMALSQHVVRPRISREEADKILGSVLEWARRVNAEEQTRVRVKSIDIYGSFERGVPDVGDIDLILIYTPGPGDEDVEPEDMERQDELTEDLVAISEYISLASEFDKRAMPDAGYRQIFP